MPCYHPLAAVRSGGQVKILSSVANLRSGEFSNLTLPCGQCIGCRLERSRQWAIRCMHEASLHENNDYVTLTYSDDHVPHDGGLNHRHFQLFMKRLRKYFNRPVRYYMCGEYGGNFGRPHFHALLFGISFLDRTPWQKSPSGFMLYRSETLERLWPFGFSSIGDVTFDSAAYVARYIMKKHTGADAYRTYQTVSTVTGEIYDRVPEYNRMSLKPGIGADWFVKYSSDVYPHDHVVIDGSPSKPPRFYDKLLSRVDPDTFLAIKDKRMLDIADSLSDNTPARLVTKEIVTKAAISQLKRSL